MATSDWTKGPWRVDPDDRPSMEYNNHICNAHGTICFMAHNGPASQDEFDAAARLIAAAPELYEALAAVAEDVCSLTCPSVWKTSEGPQPHSDKCKAARSALAKAKGQQG